MMSKVLDINNYKDISYHWTNMINYYMLRVDNDINIHVKID